MKSICKKILSLTVVLPFFFVTAHAASFDCEGETTKNETLICTNRTLSQLDDQLNLLFTVISTKPNGQARADQQQLLHDERRWLLQRNQCTTVDCLINLHRSRINELQKIVETENPYQGSANSAAELTGTWGTGGNQFERAKMDLKFSASNHFTFSIESHEGDNSCSVDGDALLQKNNALFVGKSVDDNEWDSSFPDCVILFQFTNSKTVNITSFNCGYLCGLNTYFDGPYIKNLADKTDNLVALGLLDNSDQETAFKKMVGQSAYDLFMNTAMMVTDETKDYVSKVPNFSNAKVRTGYVLHDATSTCIVVIGANGNLYAAVTNWSDDGHWGVDVYTNDLAFKNKTPPVIQMWINDLVANVEQYYHGLKTIRNFYSAK